jgi:hypothetical protein
LRGIGSRVEPQSSRSFRGWAVRSMHWAQD